MLKKFFLINLIVLIRIASFSQSEYIYYFDDNINLVKKSQAVLKGVGAYENGNFELRVFDKKSKLLLSIWHFTDSTLQVTNGLFVTYYSNKMKEMEGSYLLGKKDGLWRKWNRVGNIIDSSLYINDEIIMHAGFLYYFDRKLMEINIDSVKEGKKELIFYDEKGKIIPVFPKMVEDPDKIFTKVEIMASFPGGPAAWQRYISKAIESNLDDFTNSDYGTVLVRFIVDIEGKVSNVEATTMKGTKIAKVATDAIIKGPKWVPAQQNGRFVNSYRIQPVTLVNPNY